MAALSDTDRNRIRNKLMRHWSDAGTEVNSGKAAIRTAINGADDWQDTHLYIVNAADSDGGRSAFTVAFRNNNSNRVMNEIHAAVSLARIGMPQLNRWLGEEN